MVWIHAASIGETNSVLPLIQEIIKNNQKIFVLLTTTTLTSSQIVNKIGLNTRYPFIDATSKPTNIPIHIKSK